MILRPLACAALTAATSAAAGDPTSDPLRFASPSGNIECIITEAYAFCSIAQYTPSFTEPPANCHGDWGNHFELGTSGPAELSCVTDYPGSPTFVLPYGASISFEALSCTSTPQGMICQNATSGGFSLRRAEQKIY